MPEYFKTIEDGFEVVTLQSGGSTAQIVPKIGNTLFNLILRGKEILFFPQNLAEYSKNKNLFGNPFLFPWANRLESDSIIIEGEKINFPDNLKHLVYRDKNGLPLHGLVLKSDSWEISGFGKNNKTAWMETILKWNSSLDTFPLFPFELTISTRFELEEDFFRTITMINNESNKTLPLSFGYHPYFTLKGKRENILLNFPVEQYYETDDLLLPTGNLTPLEKVWNHFNKTPLDKLNLDHGFPIAGKNFFFTDEEKTVEIIFEEGYNTAVIYAPNNSEKPFICVEPMTAHTNAMHLSEQRKIPTISSLVRGESQSFSFSISIK